MACVMPVTASFQPFGLFPMSHGQPVVSHGLLQPGETRRSREEASRTNAADTDKPHPERHPALTL